MTEYSHKIKEEVKAMKSEIKRNVQGTNSEGKETGTQNQQFGPERRKKHSTRTEWRNNNKKIKERLRNLWDNFKHSNIWIIGVPEGEEQEQDIENLFENIMKVFLQSGKGNRLPGIPGSSESPKEVGPKEARTKAHHNSIAQDER